MKKILFNKGGKAIAFTALVSLFAVSCSKEPGAGLDTTTTLEDQQLQAASRGINVQPSVPNEILVKFKAGTSSSKRDEALARVKGNVLEHIITKAMNHAGDKEGIMLIHTPLEAIDAIARIKGLEIVYAEPNYIYNHDAVTNDNYFINGSLWGMYGAGTSPANQYGCNAAAAWAAGNTGSADVYVGIIDEGIQFDHPDLIGQIWTNKYDPVDGIDNDNNGYKDDIHGWDFDGNDNTIYDGGPKGGLDDHGTHVSGTIGGKAGNSIGVAGVNWKITIISAKFLGRRGGTLANAVKAVDYLNDLKTRHPDINIVASNNSWGGGGFSQSLSDAIKRGNGKTGTNGSNGTDILFIAAAGNGGNDGVGDNNDVTASYPSNYEWDNVIAVAAITSTGARASFTNYGATTVDLGAPGQGVWSTTAFNGYSSYSGTSMATPHVTGAAALYKSTHSSASGADIKAAILSNTIATSSLTGRCVSNGRLNVGSF